jgi:hypothetical protein
MEITPIFPRNEDPIDFDLIDCQITGTDFQMVEDQELNYDNPPSVLEIMGSNNKIKFYTDCPRPYLILHFKTMKRYATVEFIIIDEDGHEKHFIASNKTSFITVDGSECKLPLVSAQDGWQYCCIDLEDLTANAFGSIYFKCREITIHGTCRLSKLFFSSKQYADIELPKFLRVVTTD